MLGRPSPSRDRRAAVAPRTARASAGPPRALRARSGCRCHGWRSGWLSTSHTRRARSSTKMFAETGDTQVITFMFRPKQSGRIARHCWHLNCALRNRRPEVRILSGALAVFAVMRICRASSHGHAGLVRRSEAGERFRPTFWRVFGEFGGVSGGASRRPDVGTSGRRRVATALWASAASRVIAALVTTRRCIVRPSGRSCAGTSSTGGGG
jgi:hypothetical protein